MAQHNDLGNLGEQAAVAYLLNKEYEIIETNWRYKKAEIDIIAKTNQTLVCVEVKTRSSNHIAEPENFVNQKKISLLIDAINQYVEQKEINLDIRFDIISILYINNKYTIKHIENAFYHF